MKIKVLHVVLSLEVGGLENGVVNLINNHETKMFQVDVLCLRKLGDLAKRITNDQCKIHFDGTSANSITAAILKVRRCCIKGNYDIVHTHSWGTLLTGYLGKIASKTPVLVHGEHGTLWLDSWTHRFVQKLIFRRVDLMLTVSNRLKQDICRLFQLEEDLILPILNGVDAQHFLPKLEYKIEARKKLDLNENHFIIGTVGRLEPVKNYRELIEGFSLFAKNHKKAILIFIGDGELKSELEHQAKTLDVASQVRFLGLRDDVPSALSVLDVFALTSVKEGLSNSILEAMSCGLPVIASDVGGNSELVRPEETGYLYPLNDINQFSQLLLQLYNSENLRKQFSRQARTDVLQKYSLIAMVRQYEAQYKQLVTAYFKNQD